MPNVLTRTCGKQKKKYSVTFVMEAFFVSKPSANVADLWGRGRLVWLNFRTQNTGGMRGIPEDDDAR